MASSRVYSKDNSQTVISINYIYCSEYEINLLMMKYYINPLLQTVTRLNTEHPVKPKSQISNAFLSLSMTQILSGAYLD